MSSERDPGLAAFHRLLADAQAGGQAKVDALVALSQRTVHVVPWPGGVAGYRTLVNSDGLAALPVFTERPEVEEAARRFGWADATGACPSSELGARAALNYARNEELAFVVVDIAAEHRLEVGQDEFAPLLTSLARRDSSGPFAATGRVSSSLIQAVRPTPPPDAIPAESADAPPPPSSMPPAARTGFTDPPPPSDPDAELSLHDPAPLPADEVIEVLTDVLRGYPEVEWGCLCRAVRPGTTPSLAVGLLVDREYRQRIESIRTALSEKAPEPVELVLLDDPELRRVARQIGEPFYPWRRR